MPLPQANPTVIVLAAGRGERFYASGGQVHKLAAVFKGKTVLQHTLDAVIASGLPYHVVVSLDDANLGMGDSIARGVAATPAACGWLILPADLPKISTASVLAVAHALQTSAPLIAVVQAFVAEKAAHPVGFNLVCRERLLSLKASKDDAGARSVVQHYKALGQWQAVALLDAGALGDVDTVADLARLSQAKPTA